MGGFPQLQSGSSARYQRAGGQFIRALLPPGMGLWQVWTHFWSRDCGGVLLLVGGGWRSCWEACAPGPPAETHSAPGISGGSCRNLLARFIFSFFLDIFSGLLLSGICVRIRIKENKKRKTF